MGLWDDAHAARAEANDLAAKAAAAAETAFALEVDAAAKEGSQSEDQREADKLEEETRTDHTAEHLAAAAQQGYVPTDGDAPSADAPEVEAEE